MTATLLSGASALPLTVWQACFLAMPVANATRSPTALRRVCWRARPSTSPPIAPPTAPRASSLPNFAAELGGDLSHMPVARIWAKHGLKPHRLEGYLASNDPDFETKAADVIG